MLDNSLVCTLFFFNDTATTEIYTYCHTLSLHDALPILSTDGPTLTERLPEDKRADYATVMTANGLSPAAFDRMDPRSEEHTSELQSLMRNSYAVFCLKKKTKIKMKPLLRNYIGNTVNRKQKRGRINKHMSVNRRE